MLLGDFPIKREGSQGQNKTYLVALKLAQFDFLKRTATVQPHIFGCCSSRGFLSMNSPMPYCPRGRPMHSAGWPKRPRKLPSS